jgi:hypothetical protein
MSRNPLSKDYRFFTLTLSDLRAEMPFVSEMQLWDASLAIAESLTAHYKHLANRIAHDYEKSDRERRQSPPTP